jgi:hypothetical protein
MDCGIGCIESWDFTATVLLLLWGTDQINCKGCCPKFEDLLEVIIMDQHMYKIRLRIKIFYSLTPGGRSVLCLEFYRTFKIYLENYMGNIF